MPNFIYSRYRLCKVSLDNQAAIFAYPNQELDSISSVKKHINRIKTRENVPVVLVLNNLTYRQKEYLIHYHIPFVVEGKQVYLPFLAVYLQQRASGERQGTDIMLPSAQLLLLYYIYNGCKELSTSEASKKLSFSPMSISRASRQLEDMGLIRAEKQGVNKIIISNKTPKQLFFDARNYMRNPVKRTIYVPKTEIKQKLLISGYSALSEYSMLNTQKVKCFATHSISKWESVASSKLEDEDEQLRLELWRYNPEKLSNGDCVDRLSLALALFNDRDERIEESIDEMLANVWRDIE